MVRIKIQEIKKATMNWEHTIMLFTLDEGIQIANTHRYIKAVWPELSPMRVIKQIEGYFLIMLKNKRE